MKLIRNVAAYAIFLELLLLFLVTSIFVRPGRILRPIKSQLRLIFRVFGLRIRARGIEHLKAGQTYLLMCNHISFVDHFILLAYLPGYFVGLEAIEASRVPIYGWAGRRWGQIHINRGDREAAIEACRQVVSRLATGLSVAVFPEGTRTRNGRLGPFKKGVFHIAADSHATVVPVVIQGLHPLLPRGNLLAKSGDVELIVCEPLSAVGEGPDAYAELSARVRSAMLQTLGEEESQVSVPATAS